MGRLLNWGGPRWKLGIGFLLVEIWGISVGVVCLYGFGMIYYSTVMVIISKRLYDITAFIGESDDRALVISMVVEGAVGVGDA